MPPPPAADLEYLCVDRFLRGAVEARALKSALELGLIDHLATNPAATPEDARRAVGGDQAGIRLLLDLLRANEVTEEGGGTVRLTAAFRTALRFRDLLEAKLDFALFAAADFLDHFSDLLVAPGRFMREGRLFDLFDYRRAFDPSPESYERTARWMRFTTALTRYEGAVCAREYDFGRHRRMLDIGGNSGEFAIQVCRRHPALRATVVDLPVVCDIGREHVRRQPEADRITFHPGDALADPLPAGADLIAFKSVLHDWPEREAGRFLDRAYQALAPGGAVLIFERGPFPVGGATPSFADLPMLLFFRSFRPPAVCQGMLESVGFSQVAVRWIDLEMPFALVTAVKEGPNP